MSEPVRIEVPKTAVDEVYSDVYGSTYVLQQITGDPGIGPASRIIIKQQIAILENAVEKLHRATTSD